MSNQVHIIVQYIENGCAVGNTLSKIFDGCTINDEFDAVTNREQITITAWLGEKNDSSVHPR